MELRDAVPGALDGADPSRRRATPAPTSIAAFDAAAAPTTIRPPSASQPNASPPPFVGRAVELGALDDAFSATRDGHSVAMLVQGESGVGKSISLVRRFAEEVHAARRGGPGRSLLRARDACPTRRSRRRHRRADVNYMVRIDRAEAAALLPDADGAPGHGVPRAPARRGGGAAAAQADERGARSLAAARARVRGGARALGPPRRSAAAGRGHR